MWEDNYQEEHQRSKNDEAINQVPYLAIPITGHVPISVLAAEESFSSSNVYPTYKITNNHYIEETLYKYEGWVLFDLEAFHKGDND